MADDEGFLDRWSRRKLAEKEQPAEAAQPDPRQDAALPDRPPGAEGPQAAREGGPERHPAEDIDIDALTPESDFSIFMQKGVPAALKQKALRKLWVANPVYAGKEPLSDMFDLADTKTWGIGPIRGTSWKVGQGYGIKDLLGSEEEAPAEPVGDEAVADAEAPPPRDEAEAAGAGEAPKESGAPEERLPEAARAEDEDGADEKA